MFLKQCQALHIILLICNIKAIKYVWFCIRALFMIVPNLLHISESPFQIVKCDEIIVLGALIRPKQNTNSFNEVLSEKKKTPH